ncbi:hypothetical protein YC2023_101678 [Brassica napus]
MRLVSCLPAPSAVRICGSQLNAWKFVYLHKETAISCVLNGATSDYNRKGDLRGFLPVDPPPLTVHLISQLSKVLVSASGRDQT